MTRYFYLAVMCLLSFSTAVAQTPVALPYTLTTLAGGTPTATTAGSACPTLPTAKATDGAGDGCPAANGVLGLAGRGGVAVDSYGNLFVDDDVTGILHMINPTTGIMTAMAGTGTICTTAAGALDKSGDGCAFPAAVPNAAVLGARGVGIDPYGNVLLAGYTDKMIHILCRAASPLCTSAQVGTMQLMAGCVTTKGSGGGATGGASNDGFLGRSVGTACSATLGETNAPRGATADIYGNVYYADSTSSRYRVVLGPLTSSYFNGNNPLYTVLTVFAFYASPTAGNVYTIANLNAATGTAAQVLGTACKFTYGQNTTAYTSTVQPLDVYGDGCPFQFSSLNLSSSGADQIALVTDAAGNLIFVDAGHGLRVFYVSDGTNFASGTAGYIAGQAMKNAIHVNNSTITPTFGYIYMLAGGGATALSATPHLGNSVAALDTSSTKVTLSPQGNIYVGDSTRVLFFDIATGYIRTLTTTGAYTNGNGLGVAVDGQGNLYLYDQTTVTNGTTTSMLVRKVFAQGLPAQSLGVPASQTFYAHFPSATASSVTLTNSTNADLSYGMPSCAALNGDGSLDCSVKVTATPSQAGSRSAAMTLAAPGGESLTFNLGGTVSGAVLAVDNAAGLTTGASKLLTTNALLSGNTPSAVAVDGAGNLFAASGTSILESLAASTTSTQTLATGLSAAPTAISVDPTGNIFYLNGSSSIQELAVTAAGAGSATTYSAATLAYTPNSLGTADPVALATDKAGNLFVADEQSSAGTIYRISPTALAANSQAGCSYPATASSPVLPSLCQTTVSTVGAFGVVSSLTVDPSGNVYVADTTNGAVYKLAPGATGTYTQSTVAGVTPGALAIDAAGDLYVQSGATVTEYPVSGVTAGVTVLSGLTNPVGLAVDGLGNVYSADASQTSVTQVQRGAVVEDFGSNYTAQFTATLTNVGNLASGAQNTTNGAQAGDFTLGGCTFSTNLLSAMTAGQACNLTAVFPAIGSAAETDLIAFSPVSPTTLAPGLLTLTGTADLQGYDTTTTIGAGTPASPVFAASGTEVSFPITVTANGTSTDGSTTITSGPTTANYANISVDGGPAAAYNFTATNGLSASFTLNLSGLTAGNHSFAVTFPQQGSFLPSTATSGTITLAQQISNVAWSPSATSQYVSAAIGTGVLNATEQSGIAGNVAYSVVSQPTCTTTSTPTVDASTYLAAGSYTLYATFCPTDSTDYLSATSSIAYTVMGSAPTTATVGASTMVVAADGSGNFTSLTTALESLPVTGGTIYIKPGTYTGQNAISYPNVQLRGLGGDPTQVILSGENGAWPTGTFNTSNPPTGFSLGPVGKGGDEGSAVLDISKSAFIGLQGTAGSVAYTPNNFYAENLTIQNTFDTDAVTTTQWGASSNGSSTCTQLSTPGVLQTLYNNNGLCGSQALALWINSDGAILNNVNLLSQQDTLYASGIGCGTYCTVAREYMFKGLITGDVDYVFGDAALVFDHTNFLTTWHGINATGQETIEAQNKRYPTGTTSTTNSSFSTSSDYLSGFICNGCNLMSQGTGMTKLYYGRPYDISTSNYPSSYSTWIMLNSFVDQVNPAGWIGWDGASEYLNTATYGEYNTQAFTDPALCTSANAATCTDYPYPTTLFNPTDPSILYTYSAAAASDSAAVPAGGNSGSGVTGTRESSALMLNAATATQYYPVNFLSTFVPSTKLATGQPASWNPVNALAAQVNAFAPTSSVGSIPLGGSVTILGRPQTPGAGVIPTGSYAFFDSLNVNQVCSAASSGCTQLSAGSLDASGEASLTTTALPAGLNYITMVFVSGDSNFAGSVSSTYSIYVLGAGQTATTTTLAVNNTSSTLGTPITGTVAVSPSAASGTVTLYLDGSAATNCTLSNGSCTWSINGPALGAHSIYASYPGNASYGISSSASIAIEVVAVVATGDSRPTAGVEPSFPAVCQQLTADIADVNNDIPTSIDGGSTVLTNPNLINPTVTNPDGGRIQAALNACSATALATSSTTTLSVELSADTVNSYDAFLSGPISMPSNVTLLVDPGVTLYFSRNAQDYYVSTDSGSNICGTINSNSANKYCRPLIEIPKTSTNVGIMGFGKLNGRGGDVLLNPDPAYAGFSWWDLSAAANGVGNQQNPRFIQMDSGSSNITLYKISLFNSPLFHVSTTGGISGFTAWDIKIVTPTFARNTDGIDPGNANNVTITRSWISDGDDNVALGASGTAPNTNVSVTNNHFFAGHGESIGSYTTAGVSNALFDGNMSVGNAFASHGSAIGGGGTVDGTTYPAGYADTNSTAVRIKTANDRGGLVTGIQYSNSCFLDHKADIQFTPYYSNGDSTTAFPSFTNILLQNLVFLNDSSSSGTVELTGEYNSNATGGSPVTNPLVATLDNVTFPSGLSSLVNSTSPVYSTTVWGTGDFSGGTGQYTDLTIGPGQVSSNFLTALNTLVANSNNNDVLTNNAVLSNLNPPVCTFTYIAPELTGPNGLPQTIAYGSTAKLVVILTPAVSGAAYPTGTVTLTDAMSGSTYTGTFTGTGDTIAIPVAGLAVGIHTFTATSYTGDSNYTVSAFGSYVVTVNFAFSPSASTLPSGTYGTSYSTTIAASGGTAPYTYTVASGSSLPPGLTLTASGANAGLISGTPTLAGSTPYTFTIVATDSTPGTPLASSVTYSLTINKAPLTVTANSFTIAYGAALPTFTASYKGFVNGDTAAVLTGAPLLTSTATATSGVGTYPINASAAGTPTPLSSPNYTFTFVSGTLTINKATPAVALTGSPSAAFVNNAVTFTVTASFATAPSTTSLAGPSGTVSFTDGGTALSGCTAVAQNSNGTWTCTLNSATAPLSLGAHTIAAVYNGDANFVGSVNSPSFTETIADFSITTSSSSTTITAGSLVSFTYTVSPVSPSTTFPAAITLTASGLPSGSGVNFVTSGTIAACTTSCSTTVTMEVQTPAAAAALRPGSGGTVASHLAPFSLALLLLPFAGLLRRSGRRLSRVLSILLLFAAGAAAVAGISGCNSGASSHGQPASYTVYITGTSGTLSHTSPSITLTVK
jgi:pectin methylesterase-like acyl-CoA thioesterase